jgi:hypothetical protein
MKITYWCICALLLYSFLQSCNSTQQPSAASKQDNAFNLEAINFTEKVPSLYASNLLLEEGVRYDSARDGQLTDSMLRYKISNTIIDIMKLKVPQQDFGYLYKSPTIDTLAKFQHICFETLATLTDNNKKPIAYFASVELRDPKDRKKLLEEFKKKYGNPVYSFFISSEFNQCSYEWQLKDRTIQIETSNGFSFSITSNDTTAQQSTHYSLDMLIIDNKYKSAIHDAHMYEFPEKILYDGKLHSYKDFQFEKQQVFRDNFLLNSTNEKYIKNESGEYDISRAEEE